MAKTPFTLNPALVAHFATIGALSKTRKRAKGHKITVSYDVNKLTYHSIVDAVKVYYPNARFVEVTQDRLQAIQLGILDLEKPESNAAAEGVARELHTMKGEARMLGLAAIGQLAHCCEDLLKGEREKKVDTRSATDLLLHACDAISDLLDDLEAAKEGSDASNEMANKLSQASGIAMPP